MADDNGAKIGWRVLDIILSLTVTLATTVVVWTASTVVDLRTDLAEIKANRFTSQDALDVWKEIADIRETMASLPTDVPPKWLLDQFNELKLEVRTLRTDLNEYLLSKTND